MSLSVGIPRGLLACDLTGRRHRTHSAHRRARRYALRRRSDAGPRIPPETLKGRWLEECGFITRMPVTVTVKKGKKIIEPKINL
ncbi:SymE family type I addiction module toxin [Lonsdalea quercina]|uniref:SymE family type I addiction module toxin n=1 Tax=Lonsdalea quercina TaxID=71657 RepID=UPI003974DD6F